MMTSTLFGQHLDMCLCGAATAVWDKHHARLDGARLMWYWGPDMIQFYLKELERNTGGMAKPTGISNLRFRGVPVRAMRQNGCAIKLL